MGRMFGTVGVEGLSKGGGLILLGKCWKSVVRYWRVF